MVLLLLGQGCYEIGLWTHGGSMRTNPFTETLQFLFEAKWSTGVFWILLLASLAVAGRNWRRDRARERSWSRGQPESDDSSSGQTGAALRRRLSAEVGLRS